jgi:isopentenyl diphosphate isomerase/L-lactate dehydrogenase-like FMN-dependent dehydrogenase
MTGLPIIVRGIMNPLDAMAAAGAGASAVWVTGNFSGGASPISVMR